VVSYFIVVNVSHKRQAFLRWRNCREILSSSDPLFARRDIGMPRALLAPSLREGTAFHAVIPNLQFEKNTPARI